MILVTLIASILIVAVSIYQFKKEARDYHQERLERKEISIRSHMNYILANTTYPLTTENLPLIFRERIHELANIHGMEINIYDLNGRLLKSSKAAFSATRGASASRISSSVGSGGNIRRLLLAPT